MASGGYGLYDLAGNVFEWCWDWYANNYYEISVAMDPQGPATGVHRVLRGGSWDQDFAYGMRCAVRASGIPNLEDDGIGFRCVQPLRFNQPARRDLVSHGIVHELAGPSGRHPDDDHDQRQPL